MRLQRAIEATEDCMQGSCLYAARQQRRAAGGRQKLGSTQVPQPGSMQPHLCNAAASNHGRQQHHQRSTLHATAAVPRWCRSGGVCAHAAGRHGPRRSDAAAVLKPSVLLRTGFPWRARAMRSPLELCRVSLAAQLAQLAARYYAERRGQRDESLAGSGWNGLATAAVHA